MTKILFVCMGNICRSPTAEGVFRKMVADAGLEDSVQIASAGTHAYHAGEPADVRAHEHAHTPATVVAAVCCPRRADTTPRAPRETHFSRGRTGKPWPKKKHWSPGPT